MTPQPLRQLFDAMYYGKHNFDDFLNIDVEKNFSSVRWKARTIYKPSPLLKKFHSFLSLLQNIRRSHDHETHLMGMERIQTIRAVVQGSSRASGLISVLCSVFGHTRPSCSRLQ